MKNTNNKTIKYIAIGIGLLFAIFIFSIMARAAFSLVGALSNIGGRDHSYGQENQQYNGSFSQEFSNVSKLDISFSAGTLEVAQGDRFKVEGYNLPESFNVNQSSDTLKIEDHIADPIKALNGFSDSQRPHLTLTLPKDAVFKHVDFELGAGDNKISDFKTDKLEMDLGAGRVELKNITADEASLDNGAGEVSLSDMSINDLDMDCGVGKITFKGSLTGDCSINGGVGTINFDIDGKISDYDISGNSGLGDFSINGKAFDDKGFRNSNAPNELNINGGVGSIHINFTK